MRAAFVGAAALVIAAVGAAPVHAQRQSESAAFTWSGRIPAGRWIKVRNMNGAITVDRAAGDRVEVVATRSWRRSDPQSVRFEVKKFGPGGENVLVCAVWGERSTCEPDDYESRGVRNNDVSVSFTVRVPQGVNVAVNTVNGGLTIMGATGEVEAATVNGSIEATTSGGPVNATTVNGTIRARMGRFANTKDMTFTTVNGSIIAEFSGDLDADVDLTTVNGRFQTDYPVTVNGRIDPRRLRARVGRGGPRITMNTVNGSVELRRRD